MSASRLLRLTLLALGCGALTTLCPAANVDPDAAWKMLNAERLGDLRLELPEKDVLKLLGKPEKQSKTVLQEADGMYVQTWSYPARGLEFTMSAGKKAGPKTIASITAFPPCSFSTKKGIKIGSPEAEARKAYAAWADRESASEKGVFIAGSVSGGIIFNFAKGKVSRIFFGAAAE
jgi:hypothetical protein